MTCHNYLIVKGPRQPVCIEMSSCGKEISNMRENIVGVWP